MRTVKYPLPDVTNPAERLCIQFEIPDEPKHRQAFLGAVYSLTRWYNWEKDDDKRAKPVSDVWNNVFYQVVDAMVSGCDAGERMIELRAIDGIGSHALNWKYTDEPETEWRFLTTIYDGVNGVDGTNGRTPEFRAVRGIESVALNWKYTDEPETEWRFLTTVYDGVDGDCNCEDTPVEPNTGTICDIAVGVAERVIDEFRYAVTSIRDTPVFLRATWSWAYCTTLRPDVGLSRYLDVLTFASYFDELDPDIQCSWLLTGTSGDDASRIKNAFSCAWGTTKGYDATKRANLITELGFWDLYANTETVFSQFLSWFPVNTVKTFAIESSVFETGNDCSEYACGWTHTFDFTVSDGGWVSNPQPAGNFPTGRAHASWLSGSGWNATKTINSLNNYSDVAGCIKKTFSNTYITTVSMIYDDNPVSATRWTDGISTGALSVVTQTSGFGNNLTKSVTLNTWTTQLVAWVWVVGGAGAPSGIVGTGKIKSITVQGKGINPFV